MCSAFGTKIAQGWPKSWAKFSPLIGILSQKLGQAAQWANPPIGNYLRQPVRDVADLAAATFRVASRMETVRLKFLAPLSRNTFAFSSFNSSYLKMVPISPNPSYAEILDATDPDRQRVRQLARVLEFSELVHPSKEPEPGADTRIPDAHAMRGGLSPGAYSLRCVEMFRESAFRWLPYADSGLLASTAGPKNAVFKKSDF
jgi:hypothetical protein